MKRVLVIGSSGLLGSHLVKALEGKAEVVEASRSNAPLKVDISDAASLRRLFEQVGPVDAIATTANAAVEGFVRAAAVEIGSRVRVNVVSPGWITETLLAMGMDPTPGLPAAEAAEYFVRQMERGPAGGVLAAAKRG